jgi:pimeloyl-ACP methyl ester carboxylesterase
MRQSPVPEVTSSPRPVQQRDTRRRLVDTTPMDDRVVECAGIRTAVLEGGEGPPILLLHGPGEFGPVWAPAFPDLVATHRVIAPDMPGHGATGVGDGALSPERIFSWLDDVITHTCRKPPILAGHLLGGSIALRYAATHPGRLARILLVDSFGIGKFRPAADFTLALVGFMARPTAKSQERVFRKCFLDLDQVRETLGEQMTLMETYALECAQNPIQKVALRQLMWNFAVKPVPGETLAAMPVPVGMIWGREDPQVRLKLAQAASERFGWPLRVIDGAADDPFVERPEASLRAMRELMAH